jgi:hypothetical protein
LLFWQTEARAGHCNSVCKAMDFGPSSMLLYIMCTTFHMQQFPIIEDSM